jgi:transposase
MARSTVFGWMAADREGGLEALRARPVPGRRPKLSGAQLGRLYGLVVGNDLGSCGSRPRCGPVTGSAS